VTRVLRRRSPAAELVAGFHDLDQMHSGDVATLYRAVETETGRPVTLELLSVPAGSAHLRAAIEAEARDLARISHHPHVVTLYRQTTAADGRPVRVYEPLSESLAERVRSHGPLPAPAAVSMAVRLAGAVATAHAAGMWHREVKPQSVYLTQFGEPVLLEFGRSQVEAGVQAAAGVLGAVTLHAAPEVLEGGEVSAAADVYGLASTLYFLLIGQPPFAAFAGEALASVVLRILHDPAPSLRAPSIPLSLADVVDAALAKDPTQRPSSARALGEHLRTVEVECGWPVTPMVVAGGPEPEALRPTAPAAVATGPERWQAPVATASAGRASRPVTGPPVGARLGALGFGQPAAPPAGAARRAPTDERGPDATEPSAGTPLAPSPEPPPLMGPGPAPAEPIRARRTVVEPVSGRRRVVDPVKVPWSRSLPSPAPLPETAPEPSPGPPPDGPAVGSE
jgi:hypothetical protein